MYVGLVMLRTRRYHIVICSLSDSNTFSHIISHKRYDYQESVEYTSSDIR